MNADLAVVGIGCRLPGADDPRELWELVRSGATTFEPVPREDSLRAGYTPEQIDDPAFVAVRSALRDHDAFDAERFGITARDAALMDPQHRVFLETVHAALHDAGIDPADDVQVGVFGSSSTSTYLPGPVTEAGLWSQTDLNFSAMLANDKDFLCTRTSYTLGLRGPSVVVQSACSSSLLAVHLARASIERGECDVAVVAGVSISLPFLGGYLQRAGGIFSSTGVCRPFDAAADGTVKANGAAAVVLTRVQDADPRRVYALLAGSAANNDGNGKPGFPSPGVAGQRAVIAAALADAGIDGVDYVETHGTGTALGDPIELRALGAAIPGGAYLGSIKATLGHADAAAGVTGLVKAALVLNHGTVPPMPGFATANPLLELGALTIPTVPVPLPDGDRTASVSSFGMGGTNVHVVLHREAGLPPREHTAAPAYARTRHWVASVPRESVLATAAAVVPNVAPVTASRPLVDTILRVARDVLQEPALDIADDLFDAGADSLAVIDLVAELRDLGLTVGFAEVERARTTVALADLLTPMQDCASAAQLVPIVLPNVPSARNLVTVSEHPDREIFLVHPAGGTTTCYLDIARRLDPHLGVIGLYFPEDLVGSELSLRQLAARYLAAIREHRPEGPYLLGGYSFGGNLAAEMALQLAAEGEKVEHLVLIDSHPPHAYTSGDCTDADYLAAFPTLLRTLFPGLRFSADPHAARTGREILDLVAEPAWSAGMRAELGRFFTVWRENHGALKRWTPDTTIDCPVLVLEASDPEPQEILDRLGIAMTSVHEWERYVGGPVVYVSVRGDHYGIVRDPIAVSTIGRAVRDALA